LENVVPFTKKIGSKLNGQSKITDTDVTVVDFQPHARRKSNALWQSYRRSGSHGLELEHGQYTAMV
jgi:hypothetical protein